MRLLVVEDEPKMAALLRRGLSEEGYAVDVSDGGLDAVWMASEQDYDALVLDVMLPDVDGFSVCRQLRQRERWMPILMLTAKDSVPDRVTGLDVGADDYLTKPFSFDELLARIRALLRRGPSQRPAVLVAGDLTLDPATRRVERAGTEVELTPKEFALLEFLLRHAGEVVSRTRIREHVWDFAYDGDSNVVDVYIGYLRAKIDRPFGRLSIQTVRGAGYRLEPDG